LKTEDGGHTWSTIFYQPADEITHFSYADSLIGIARFSHNENGTSFDRKYNAKTTDGGLTWQEIPEISVTTNQSATIKFFPDGFGYIPGLNDEFHITNNFGESWTTLHAIPNFILNQFLDNHTFFVGDFNSMYKVDGGNTWIKISDHSPLWFHFFSPTDGISLQSIAKAFDFDVIIECNAFLTTSDGGLTWNEGPASINFFMSDINFVNDHLGYGMTAENEFRIVKIFR
jgi:photosystem II stability/assembly factor-like uncharacterized protein